MSRRPFYSTLEQQFSDPDLHSREQQVFLAFALTDFATRPRLVPQIFYG
jgi:hypothetical protein